MGLTDAFSAGLQSAQEKGSDLLRKPVAITLKDVQQAGWDAVSGLNEFSVVLPVSYGQDVSGSGVFLLDTGYAALIAELMFENDPAELPAELSDLQLTAAAEALSQIVGAMGEGISRATGRRVIVSTGELSKIKGDGAALVRSQIKEDRVAIVDCECKIGDHPPTRLLHLLPSSLADTLAADPPAGGAQAGAGPAMSLGVSQPAGPGGTQRVQVAQFGSFTAPVGVETAMPGNLDLLLDVPLEITVELGRATKRVREVLTLGPGSIVELSKLAGEPVDLLVNGKPIAKGEVVVIDENFAVRIIEILSRDERVPGAL